MIFQFIRLTRGKQSFILDLIPADGVDGKGRTHMQITR